MQALITPDFGLTFWTMLIFALLVFVLAKIVWKPFLKMVNDREDKIKNDILSAQKAKEEALKAKEEIDENLKNLKKEIDLRLKEAINQANSEKEKILIEANKKAQLLIDTSTKEIELQKNKLVQELEDKVLEVAVKLSGKVLMEISDKNLNEKISSSLLKQLEKDSTKLKG